MFLSLLRNSSIIHYRPETDQLINFIKGPFFEQHDIDILSNEISVFNNNNSLMDDKKFELLVYNFETINLKKFYQINWSLKILKQKLRVWQIFQEMVP